MPLVANKTESNTFNTQNPHTHNKRQHKDDSGVIVQKGLFPEIKSRCKQYGSVAADCALLQ